MDFTRIFQRFVLASIAKTGLAPVFSSVLGGRGAVLMFHRVRPQEAEAFQPNAHLEVTPDFLDELLPFIQASGYQWIPLTEVPNFLATQPKNAKFAAVTLDDGYADNLQFAAPLFQKHKVPYTVFLVPGFVEGQALPWWILIEQIIRNNDALQLPEPVPNLGQQIETKTNQQKQLAFKHLGRHYLTMDQEKVFDSLYRLCNDNGVDAVEFSKKTFLSWDHVRELAADPLCTIGGHTELHPSLARLSDDAVRGQIVCGLEQIYSQIGIEPKVFAYPFGFKSTAGKREFSIVSKLGLECAVTTRPGLVYQEHGDHLAALPRVSVNGLFQQTHYMKALLSGLPFLLANKGRKVDID